MYTHMYMYMYELATAAFFFTGLGDGAREVVQSMSPGLGSQSPGSNLP